MRTVLLIGMGKFGQVLGKKLLEMGDEVMVVDKNEDVINSIAPMYTNALVANCVNVNNLKKLDVPSFDACIVTISEDFQSSLEITSLLKECKAKRVIAKAATEIQRKFLLRNGADEVIFPDLDIAEKLAVKLNVYNVHDYIELDSYHSIFEIDVPETWIGKCIVDINPRQKFGINILTVKKGETVIASPDAAYTFTPGDRAVVFGNTKKIINFSNKKKK